MRSVAPGAALRIATLISLKFGLHLYWGVCYVLVYAARSRDLYAHLSCHNTPFEISDTHIQSGAILNHACCKHAVCTTLRRLFASASTRAFNCGGF